MEVHSGQHVGEPAVARRPDAGDDLGLGETGRHPLADGALDDEVDVVLRLEAGHHEVVAAALQPDLGQPVRPGVDQRGAVEAV